MSTTRETVTCGWCGKEFSALISKSQKYYCIECFTLAWETTDCGSPTGGFGISMTSLDMLRFGLLLLNDGMWDDERILPEGWAEFMQPRPNWSFSYGNMINGNGWKPLLGSSFEARGHQGQFVTIYPDRDDVVVRTGSGL